MIGSALKKVTKAGIGAAKLSGSVAGSKVGRGVIKDVAKYEAERATGGLSALVTPPSKTGRVMGRLDQARNSRDLRSAQRAGQGLKERNKMMDKKSALRSAYRDMLKIAKHSSPNSGRPKTSMGDAYLKGLAATGATMSVIGAVAGGLKIKKKMETERVWKRLKEDAPELASTPKDRENFEVLQQFAPDLASNITTARSYMQRMKHTNMTPHEFIKDLSGISKTRHEVSVGRALQRSAESSKFRF